AAVRARGGGDPRVAGAAAVGVADRRLRLRRGEPDARSELRPARSVQRLHLGLLLGDLPAAVRLPDRLHPAAPRAVPAGAALGAAADATAPAPAAGPPPPPPPRRGSRRRTRRRDRVRWNGRPGAGR